MNKDGQITNQSKSEEIMKPQLWYCEMCGIMGALMFEDGDDEGDRRVKEEARPMDALMAVLVSITEMRKDKLRTHDEDRNMHGDHASEIRRSDREACRYGGR